MEKEECRWQSPLDSLISLSNNGGCARKEVAMPRTIHYTELRPSQPGSLIATEWNY